MATREEMVGFARGKLGVRAYDIIGHHIFIAWPLLSNTQLSEYAARAETDYYVQESLRAWLDGELGVPPPNPIPPALLQFTQRMKRGERLDGRGKKKSRWNPETIKACADALNAEFGCARYCSDDNTSSLEGTACDYISQATGLHIKRVRDIIRKGKTGA